MSTQNITSHRHRCLCVHYEAFGWCVVVFLSFVCSFVRSFFHSVQSYGRAVQQYSINIPANTIPHTGVSVCRNETCINIKCVSRSVHSLVRTFVDLFGVPS